MTSKQTRNVLSMKEYKAVLEESSGFSKSYLEIGHLYKRMPCYQGQNVSKEVGIEV